jgi:hypothetical protein
MTDLGRCNAIITAQDRCPGRLIVDREVGGIAEAICDRCGCLAARPLRTAPLNAEARPVDRDEEPWWSK